MEQNQPPLTTYVREQLECAKRIESAGPPLPEYLCTKRMRAAQILFIEPPASEGSRMWCLLLDLGSPISCSQQPVPVEYIEKHAPVVGGYFIRDSDGNSGYKAKQEFKDNYWRAPELKPLTGQALLDHRIFGGPMFSEKELAALEAYDGPPLRFNQVTTLKGIGDGPDGQIGDRINGPDYGGNHG